MCLGIPTQIIEIDDVASGTAIVELGNVRREVNVALLLEEAGSDDLLGQWAIVHAGFAISLVDQDEAQAMLDTLAAAEQLS